MIAEQRQPSVPGLSDSILDATNLSFLDLQDDMDTLLRYGGCVVWYGGGGGGGLGNIRCEMRSDKECMGVMSDMQDRRSGMQGVTYKLGGGGGGGGSGMQG